MARSLVATKEADEWDEGQEELDEDGDEDNDEADTEAEAIARRLGDQLWADINKAHADRAAASVSTHAPVHSPHTIPHASGPHSNPVLQPHLASKKEEAINTMKVVLSYAQKDTLVRSVFSSTIVPDTDGESVLDVFKRIVESGTLSKELAKPLAGLVVSLAKSEILFAILRQSNAASIQLEKGKRKREESDQGWQYHDHPSSFRRPFLTHCDLQPQVTEAVRLVTRALGANPPGSPIDPSLISSIQLQLHQIFLFAVTASAGGGPEMNALQEISGLVQVVGVLSGIPIGSTSGTDHKNTVPQQLPPVTSQNPTTSWFPGAPAMQTTDIGTAVYPCLVPACHKIFSRLYSLRAHQRGHATHRPFRCGTCPASFARNHDLKRHAKLHDKKAWKCRGCDKIFSRRDAIKRHKNSNRTRGGKSDACLTAEVIEVDLEREGDVVVKEGRRAKMWSGGYGGGGQDRLLEEGEVDPAVIAQVTMAITSLHRLLQAHVANVLGIPSAEQLSSDIDPTAGQATLASVIARAQLQNLQLKTPHHAQQPGLLTVPGAATDHGTPSEQQPSLIKDWPNEATDASASTATPTLSRYGLSEEQTRMLEQAIANAASAAHAQAEAEAALEEEEKGYEDDEDEGYDESQGNEGPEAMKGVSQSDCGG
jgi:hypothetical protein